MTVCYKKKFSFLIILIVATSLCAGCRVTEHSDYAFTEPKTSFSVGSIHGKIRGTNKTIDKDHSSTGSPYELLVWFSANKSKIDMSCNVILNEMTLKNVEHNVVVPITPTIMATFELGSDGNYYADVFIKNLELEYAIHELSFVYSFTGDCFQNKLATKVKFEFRKNYKKRKISFWDSLMGI